MTASDHTFASYRKPLDTGVSIIGLKRGKNLKLPCPRLINTDCGDIFKSNID